MLTAGNRDSTGYVKFDTSSDKVVNMRIATSLISIEQAKHNLGARDPADRHARRRVAARAQRQWDDKLGAIEVEGATADQRTTLYSNLYRLILYPNSAFENTGTAARPR